VCVGEGGWVFACGHESGDVCDVGHECCADLICNFAEFFEIDLSWVGGVATEDDFGFVFFCGCKHGVVVYLFVLGMVGVVVECVVDGVVEDARKIEVHAVGEVAAVFEDEGEEGVAWFHDGHECGGVCLCA